MLSLCWRYCVVLTWLQTYCVCICFNYQHFRAVEHVFNPKWWSFCLIKFDINSYIVARIANSHSNILSFFIISIICHHAFASIVVSVFFRCVFSVVDFRVVVSQRISFHFITAWLRQINGFVGLLMMTMQSTDVILNMDWRTQPKCDPAIWIALGMQRCSIWWFQYSSITDIVSHNYLLRREKQKNSHK